MSESETAELSITNTEYIKNKKITPNRESSTKLDKNLTKWGDSNGVFFLCVVLEIVCATSENIEVSAAFTLSA